MSSTELETPVLISGAGPSGLVAALTLVKNGVPVRIITNDPEHRAVGQRGAGPRTLEYYNLLGILPDVLNGGASRRFIRIYKLPGGVEPLKTFEMAPHVDPTPAIPYPNAVLIGQDHSEAILRSHLAKYGCHVELGTELRTLEQFPDHVLAHVVKTDGGVERTETIRCRWLIGADGARGVVRKQLGLSFLGETREGQRILFGDVDVQGLDRDHWHIWGDAATAIVVLRPTEYDDNSFAIVTGSKDVDNQTLLKDREALIRLIHSTTNRDDLVIGEFRSMSDFRPNIRMVDRFGAGRGFVVGDAAHTHSPTGGQGLNSSVQDAVNLSWKLALVEKGIAAPSLLETYTEERLPVIAEMLEKTTELLNKTMRAGDLSAWDRRSGALDQLGVNCRWSSIVVDERASDTDEKNKPSDAYGTAGSTEVRAGDRAPDAPGLVVLRGADSTEETGAQTSLFQTFGISYHTVLLFTTDANVAKAASDILAGYPAGTTRCVVMLPAGASQFPVISGGSVLIDQEGHAHVGYNVASGTSTIVIVRPDGTVGGVVLGVEGLRRYFKSIFSA
ncbi:Pentachlorophenol 4-monooxygenase [Grifola frondosa]|uniref:Pentachlorophenol 4-monooxygenase n=1 Tax=Grifola frondosa TaxID=5627 RepID=A0A1C7LQ38_GRIFR|nr:Pentachlorophenol 4-monooxygenase [Grifola frondosa]